MSPGTGHPLDGPRFKIRRAERQIAELRRAEEALRADSHYEVVPAEVDPQTGQQVYRVRIATPPPLDWWGVIIGEIAHNLRSALDGLVYQLALLTTKAPARSQIPIFLKGRMHARVGRHRHSFEGALNNRGKLTVQAGDGRFMIRQLSNEHQAIIERLQPYKRGRGGRRNALYLLSEVNNADKHRLIQVAGAWLGAGPTIKHWGEHPSGPVVFAKERILKDGAKLLYAPPDVHVDTHLLPLVVFAKGCPAVGGRGVCLELDRMVQEVSNTIESFAPEFG